MNKEDMNKEDMLEEIDQWLDYQDLHTDFSIRKEIGDLIESRFRPERFLKPSVVVRRTKWTVYVLNDKGEIETMNADFADRDCVKL